MQPFWYADKRMVPCSVRLLADSLHEAGMTNLRIVLQQWSPRVLPSLMRLGGRKLDLLLVSSMQVHAERAFALIRDAHRMGQERPLILAGGAKAMYEPTDFFELGPAGGVGADGVVTGEAFVLLDLLNVVLSHRRSGQTVRDAYEDLRSSGGLDGVPGLVYLCPQGGPHEPQAVNTGVQRLLRDLDELPMPDVGYRVLEPPHGRRTLSAQPCTPRQVGKLSAIASVMSTQGCRFRCPFCPIPASNQRTWRHKSPRRLAAEITHIHQTFGISEFFGTDDNFFNDRQTACDLMTELARTKIGEKPLGRCIRFYTEATQADVYKNRDLLPLAKASGLAAIWFGIEDITARLVNKGQNADKTAELFALLRGHRIEPMVMMIHSDHQPLHSPRGDLSGLVNQARHVYELGAVSYQCTYLGPAVGSRDFEPAARAKAIFRRVGGIKIPQAYQDGNYVVSSLHERPWRQQVNILRAYGAFYNPLNALRALRDIRKDPLAGRRLLFQVLGQIGLLLALPKLLGWAWRLRRGPIERYPDLLPARIPMRDAASGEEMNWAIENAPAVPRRLRARVPAAAASPELAPVANIP